MDICPKEVAIQLLDVEIFLQIITKFDLLVVLDKCWGHQRQQTSSSGDHECHTKVYGHAFDSWRNIPVWIKVVERHCQTTVWHKMKLKTNIQFQWN